MRFFTELIICTIISSSIIPLYQIPVFAELIQEKKMVEKYSGKIQETIQRWQSSSDLQIFAQENNLDYKDGKIRIYIYLTNSDLISNLSKFVSLESSSDNIAVAYANPNQITQIANLDFVQRIDMPISGVILPTRDITPKDNENQNYFLIIGLSISIIIIVGLIIYKRKGVK